MSVKLITFDAGNTLVYAYPSLGEIYSTVSREFGAEIAPEKFMRGFGPAYAPGARDEEDRAMWRRITRSIYSAIDELRPVEFDAWFERLYERFGKSDAWRTFDDVAATLPELRRRGVKLGLISNWDSRLRSIVAGLGLAEFLSVIKISSETRARKPDPLMFRQAEAEAGVAPFEALHVGDLVSEDIAGAHTAGWHAVLIDRMGQSRPRDGYRVIRSLTELL